MLLISYYHMQSFVAGASTVMTPGNIVMVARLRGNQTSQLIRANAQTNIPRSA
jgi:hypothetical protein